MFILNLQSFHPSYLIHKLLMVLFLKANSIHLIRAPPFGFPKIVDFFFFLSSYGSIRLGEVGLTEEEQCIVVLCG